MATTAFCRIVVVAAVALTALSAAPAGAQTLPSGWATQDIGAVGAAGSATASNGTFTVKGAGEDIWDKADAFRFVYQQLTGDGTIVARVASVQGTEAWTKVGVMMRQSLHPSSAHAFMLVSTSKGAAFQRRRSEGALSAHTAGGSGTTPRWVKLVRVGGTVTASVSGNGTTWTTVGSDQFAFGTTINVGLAVSSHDASRLATGVFDNVTITSVLAQNKPPVVRIVAPATFSEVDPDNAVELVAEATDDGFVRDVKFYREPSSILDPLATVSAPPYTTTLPTLPYGLHRFYAVARDNLGATTRSNTVEVFVRNREIGEDTWRIARIGHVGGTSTMQASLTDVTITGSTGDIWGTSDSLYFWHRELTGDGEIVARVASVTGGRDWTKAGVMFRESSATGSAHAFMLASYRKGLAFQRRVTPDGQSTHTAGPFAAAPAWVRLVRSGNLITAFTSPDGATWTEVGSDQFSMGGTVLVGLAFSTQDVNVMGRAVFERIAVTPH